MSRVEKAYPVPFRGVSTLAPNRRNGEASEQINFLSDRNKILTRRPATELVEYWFVSTYNKYKQKVFRDSLGRDVVVRYGDNGVLYIYHGFDNLDPVYFQLLYNFEPFENIEIDIVNDSIFVYDKNQTVKLTFDTDYNLEQVEKVVHVNIKAALDYEETVTIEVDGSGGSISVFYTSAKASDTDPDASRAVKVVAEELTNQINTVGNAVGIYADTLGSTIAIYENNYSTPTVRVIGGEGRENLGLFGQTVEEVDGIPLYAIHGTVIKVKPSPNRKEGEYYLKAVSVSDPDKPIAKLWLNSGNALMEEVTWIQWRDPNGRFKYDDTTLPFVVKWDETGGVYQEERWQLEDRVAGDDESVPTPDFVDGKINKLGLFQNRLVVATGKYLNFSETNNIDNFFIGSALQLLATDPVYLTSSAVGAADITHVISHNRDLLAFTKDKQFKVSGNSPVTPETVGLVQTTSFSHAMALDKPFLLYSF